MAEAVLGQNRVVAEQGEQHGGVWGFITYWGLHAWVLSTAAEN